MQPETLQPLVETEFAEVSVGDLSASAETIALGGLPQSIRPFGIDLMDRVDTTANTTPSDKTSTEIKAIEMTKCSETQDKPDGSGTIIVTRSDDPPAN